MTDLFNNEVHDISDVSEKYISYLRDHEYNVKRSYKWLIENTPEIKNIIPDDELVKFDLDKIIAWHDDSKYGLGTEEPYYSLFAEFNEYANYFYGEDDSEKTKSNFDLAWLHHQHVNPHHWQYWVLFKDDGTTVTIDMPVTFIIEMFCDHWSFSWKNNNLYEVFDWYEKNKYNMQLSNFTRNTYEHILNIVHTKLDQQHADTL